MAAVANYADWVARNKAPYQLVLINEAMGGGAPPTNKLMSSWLGGGGSTGVAPTTAAVPNSATAGALYQQGWGATGIANSSTGQFIGRADLVAVQRGAFVVCDRLSHQGGLDATVTTEQTTNLPTAALTRYTSGVGVMLALEIYTIIGTTATTVTARYTNQAGTGSRTTKAVVFGGTNNREASRIFLLPLQDGDTGVKSVQGVTVLASTVTPGNFGVTLLMPMLPVFQNQLIYEQICQDGLLNSCGIIPQVVNDACLFFFANTITTSVGPLFGQINLIEP